MKKVLNYDGAYAHVFGDLNHRLKNETKPLLERITQETGGDFVDIATKLKKMPICFACELEYQQNTHANPPTRKNSAADSPD